MSGVWRCPVCEGVNHGGRTCTTCGEVLPAGERVRAAVRTRLPVTDAPAPRPVPPTPRRRDLRELPRPEEIHVSEDPYLRDTRDLFAVPHGFEFRPLPGGCLYSAGPRRRRRRRYWY